MPTILSSSAFGAPQSGKRHSAVWTHEKFETWRRRFWQQSFTAFQENDANKSTKPSEIHFRFAIWAVKCKVDDFSEVHESLKIFPFFSHFWVPLCPSGRKKFGDRPVDHCSSARTIWKRPGCRFAIKKTQPKTNLNAISGHWDYLSDGSLSSRPNVNFDAPQKALQKRSAQKRISTIRQNRLADDGLQSEPVERRIILCSYIVPYYYSKAKFCDFYKYLLRNLSYRKVCSASNFELRTRPQRKFRILSSWVNPGTGRRR